MRTTITIEDELLAEAKVIAARSGRTLSEVIEDALREVRARRESDAESEEFRIHVVEGGGVLPGVDLSSNAALLDLIEPNPG